MYGKILIQCDLIVRTGMHIGASGAFSAIGAVDSPVVRDTLTGNPIVPGSSLKGKLRTLLARSFPVTSNICRISKTTKHRSCACLEALGQSERRGSSLPIALSIIKSR